MKKILSLIMAMLMILSIVPLAFAENTGVIGEKKEGEDSTEIVITTVSDDDKDPEKAVITSAPKPELISAGTDDEMAIMFIKENREIFIENVEGCFEKTKEKFPKANLDRIKKYCVEIGNMIKEVRSEIVEGKEDIKPVLISAKTQLRERLGEIREGAVIKLQNLREDQKERLNELSDEELKKVALLDRARVKKFSAESQEKLKAELSKLIVKKVKTEDLFKKRIISQEKIEKARENFKNTEEAYDKAKKSFEEEKALFEEFKNKDEEKAIEHGKKFLIHAADLVTKLLEKIKYKVEESDDLSEDEASEIIVDVDERIAAVAAAKEKVSAATTKEEVKAAGNVIIDEWNNVKSRVREHVGRLINAKVGEIIERSEQLEKKLNDILSDMKENGVEIDAIDTKVDLFSMRVEEARNKHKTAQSLFEQIKEMKGDRMTKDRINTIKTLSDQAKSLSKEAHSALKEAHTILMTIVKDVKQASGEDVDFETDEEFVEVVEDEEETDDDEDETEEDSDDETENDEDDEDELDDENEEESDDETESENNTTVVV